MPIPKPGNILHILDIDILNDGKHRRFIQFDPSGPPPDHIWPRVPSRNFVKLVQNDASFTLDIADVSSNYVIIIPSNISSGVDPFEIALKCQEKHAVGVIIALPKNTPTAANNAEGSILSPVFNVLRNAMENISNMFGEDDQEKESPGNRTIVTYARMMSQSQPSGQNCLVTIPVLFCMEGVSELLLTKRRSMPLQFKVCRVTHFLGGSVWTPESILGGRLDVNSLSLDFPANFSFTRSAFESFCNKIIEISDENTFPVGMAIIYSLRKRFNTNAALDSTSYFLEKYIFSVAWTEESLLNYKSIDTRSDASLLREKLLDFIRGNGPFSTNPPINQTISVWLFLAEAVGEEPELMRLWDAIISNILRPTTATFIERNLKELIRAIETVRSKRPRAFTENLFSYLLEKIPPNVVVTFPSLQQLLSISSPAFPGSTAVQFIGRSVAKIASNCSTFNILRNHFNYVKGLDGAYAELCEVELRNHLKEILLRFSVSDMLQWVLHHKILRQRAPTHEELLACLRKCDAFDYSVEALDLMNFAEVQYPSCSADVISVLKSKLSEFITRRKTLQLFMFLMDFANHPVVSNHFDVVLEVLRSVPQAAKVSESRSWFSEFTKNKLPLLTVHKTPNHETIMRRLVECCIKPIKPEDELDNYFASIRASSNEFVRFFSDDCLQLCLMHFRIRSHLYDVESLLAFLTHTSNLESSSVFCVLQAIKNLCTFGWEGELRQQYEELSSSFCGLFSTVTTMKLPILRKLCEVNKSIKKMESCFKPPSPSPSFQISIQMEEFNAIMSYVNANMPFITALKPYFPIIVDSFECDANLSTPEPELNLLEIRHRKNCVEKFLSHFSGTTRAFFEHFEIHANTTANKSVLFKCYLKDELEKNDPKIGSDMPGILETVCGKLKRIVNNNVTVDDIVHISSVLKGEDRRPEKELQMLCEFYCKSQNSSSVEDRVSELCSTLGRVMSLFQLRESLLLLFIGKEAVKPSIHRLHFAFVSTPNDDQPYQKLLQAIQSMEDLTVLKSWDSRRCCEQLDVIRGCFGSDTDIDQVRGILSLFQSLVDADKVWEFFASRSEFVSANGYSKIFDEKIEDFLFELGGEDYKVIDNFKTVAHWICILLSIRNKSFLDIVESVLSSRRLKAELERPEETHRFGRLITAQQNIDFVVQLFQYGLTGLNSVLAQLQALQASAEYIFDLVKLELNIRYCDMKRNYDVVMTDDQVKDFAQRLGFVQYEDRASRFDIPTYLSTLETYRQSLLVMQELYTCGHPLFPDDTVTVNAGNSLTPLPMLQNMLQEWNQKLQKAMTDNRLIGVFSTEQARRISRLLNCDSPNMLFLSVAHLYLDDAANGLCDNLADAMCSFRRGQYDDWLLSLSEFFILLEERMPVNHKFFHNQSSSKSSTVGSVTRYILSSEELSVYNTLALIFGDQRPFPFQIMWCDWMTSKSIVDDFLRRVLLYPEAIFAVVKFDSLTLSRQQQIFKAIIDNPSMRNLQLIECCPCVLQSATWLPVIAGGEVPIGFNLSNKFKMWAGHTDVKFDKSLLQCFIGPPGSGKTHRLRKLISKSPSSVIISITEHFHWDEIIRKLSSAIGDDNLKEEHLIVLQVNVGKCRDHEISQWNNLMCNLNILTFQLAVLKCVQSPYSDVIVNLVASVKWRIAIELPDREAHLEASSGDWNTWIARELPVVWAMFKFIDASEFPFELSNESIHVAKYLGAYESGLIDSLYGADKDKKDVFFVLDSSGSMDGPRLDTCKRCLMNDIFPARIQDTDRVGLIIFDDVSMAELDLSYWTTAYKLTVTEAVSCAHARGGTNMWTAISKALNYLLASCADRKKVLVALTDGGASDSNVAESVRMKLRSSEMAHNIQVLFITVGLDGSYQKEIARCCIRNPERDLIINAQNDSLAQAWKEVGDRLTVSQKIEKQGEGMAEAECQRLLRKYMKLDRAHKHWSRLEQVFWVRYMYRRCGILASSERFNKNRTMPKFGSTTMAIMLEEIERALSTDYRTDWQHTNHEQMVYRKSIVKNERGEQVEDYAWSILASNPDSTEAGWQSRKQLLSSLKMQVPSFVDISRPDRRVLDTYLAYGLGIKPTDTKQERSSTGASFDFELGSLPILDENFFVLTLDFTLKMLIINERIECGVPCIMEGETGVSKTALTRMLFELKNEKIRESEFCAKIRETAQNSLLHGPLGRALSVLREVAVSAGLESNDNINGVWNDVEKLAIEICRATPRLMSYILEELRSNPSLDPLSEFPSRYLREIATNPAEKGKLLLWFVLTIIENASSGDNWAFFPVNVHASMKMQEIEQIIAEVSKRAEHLSELADILKSERHKNVMLCVFFDEINTSNCMGVLKEIIIDHTVNGVAIPSNVIILAACNPARKKLTVYGDRKEEHGMDWVSGHYQVHPLPQSLQLMTWDYGSLTKIQEEEFIYKRVQYLVRGHHPVPAEEVVTVTALIFNAHQITRELAQKHVREAVKEKYPDMSEAEIVARASSAVSLRDILRAFRVFKYLISAPESIQLVFLGEDQSKRYNRAWLLTIAVTYYLRMGTDHSDSDRNFRRDFRSKLKSKCGVNVNVDDVVTYAMEKLMEQTFLEPGIAATRGLQENIFMVFICLLTQIPLMIVGPPGSSKTLAVTILTENARGDYSRSEVYKAAPSMIAFHYQCSRRSTSKQIQEVFDRAIERQAKAADEGANIRCFVFMDEAGLPEEGRESLKVLHYYLEGHMKVDAEVGFVAISNHVLDAAKTNRCTMLMRAPPDHDELLSITTGCLGVQKQKQISCNIHASTLNKRDRLLTLSTSSNGQYGLLDLLCESFEALMNEVSHPRSRAEAVKGFIDFFGLRDYMNFIKLLGRMAQTDYIITKQAVVSALERNFSGCERGMTQSILSYFTSWESAVTPPRTVRLTNPIQLMMSSLSEQEASSIPVGRYVLLIDTTSTDGVLRFLLEHVLRRNRKDCKLFKLSDFADDTDAQQTNLISKVRWAAEKGDIVLLSHTDKVNESFYDLFNQHFRRFEERTNNEVEVIYHTNIAMGAHSRRCRVMPEFRCLMHLTLDEVQLAPAPFLNRFEKYRINCSDCLNFILCELFERFRLPALSKILLEKVYCKIQSLLRVVGKYAFFGNARFQTIESVLLTVMLRFRTASDVTAFVLESFRTNSYRERVSADLSMSGSEVDHLCDAGESNSAVIQRMLEAPTNAREAHFGEVILGQAILEHVVRFFIDISLPEYLLARAAHLPSSIIRMIISPEKFSVFESDQRNPRQIIFTRTTPDLVLLQTSNRTTYAKKVIVSLSQVTKESQWTDFVQSYLSSKDLESQLVVIVDLSLCSLANFNFVRSKIDELFRANNNADKSIILLLHAANVDISSEHAYHTVADVQWSHRFSDGLECGSFISWLEYAYSSSSSTGSQGIGKKLLLGELDNWFLSAIEIISSSMSLRDEGEACATFDPTYRGDLLLRALFFADNSGRTLKDLLIQKFVDLWIPNDDADEVMLRSEVRFIVQQYTSGCANMSLGRSFVEEMKHMFAKFMSHFIGCVGDDVSLKALAEDASLKDMFAEVLFVGLEQLPCPALGTLHTPVKQLTLSSSKDLSFPFFRKLYRFLDPVAAGVIVQHQDEDSDEAWESQVASVHRACQQSESFESKLLVRFWGMSGVCWEAFIEKYCAILFPDTVPRTLPFEFIKNWLSTQALNYPEDKIPMLFLCGRYYKDLLLSFMGCLRPLSSLSVDATQISQMIHVSNPDDVISGMIDLCYNKLLICTIDADFEEWKTSFQGLILSASLKADRPDVIVMCVFISILQVNESSISASALTDLRNELNNRISDNKPLALKYIWTQIRFQGGPNVERLLKDAMFLVMQFFSQRLSDEDVHYVLDECIVENHVANPCQYSYLLDMIIFTTGKNDVRTQAIAAKSMTDWINAVANRAVIDDRMQSRPANARYVPHWMRDKPINSFPFITDVFFHVAWKWVNQYYKNSCSISDVWKAIRECEKVSRRDAQNIRKVVGTALKLKLIIQWSVSICRLQSCFDDDVDKEVFVSLLEDLEPHDQWTEFMKSALLLSCNGFPNVLDDVIGQWKREYAQDNQVLISWLINCQAAQQPEEKTYYVSQTLSIALSLDPEVTAGVDPIETAFTRRLNAEEIPKVQKEFVKIMTQRSLYGTMWVIPYVWGLYEWLTSEVTDYNTSEGDMKRLTIGAIIEDSKAVDDYYGRLWSKVKVGVNHYFREKGEKGTERFHDDISIIDLISVCYPTHKAEGKLVTTLHEMIDDYNKILGRTSDSATSLAPLFSWSDAQIQTLTVYQGSVISVNQIDASLEIDASMTDYLQSFQAAYEYETAKLNHFGYFQRLMWNAVTLVSSDSSAERLIEIELSKFRNSSPIISKSALKVHYCLLKGNKNLSSLSSSTFAQIFHALDQPQIHSLIQALQNLLHAPSQSESISIRELIDVLYPNNDGGTLFKLLFGVSDSDQISFLLSLQLRDVPQLLGLLNVQLQCESYIFAYKPFELKKMWPAQVEDKINEVASQTEDIADQAQRLESCLIKNEQYLTAHPEAPLIETLHAMFPSEDAMLRQYPLLGTLATSVKDCESFVILCGHYVFLRLKLRAWKSTAKPVTSKSWSWSFGNSGWSTGGDSFAAARFDEGSRELEKRKIPWFLVGLREDDHAELGELSERDKVKTCAARIIRRFIKRIPELRSKRTITNASPKDGSHVATAPGVSHARKMPPRPPPAKGRGGGRIRGGLAEMLGTMDRTNGMLSELADLLSDRRHHTDNVTKLKELIMAIESSGANVKDDSRLKEAKLFVSKFEAEVTDTISAVDQARAADPFDPSMLHRAMQRMEALGVRYHASEEVSRTLRKAESLLQRQQRALDVGMPGASELSHMIRDAEELRMIISPLILRRLEEIKKDKQVLSRGLHSMIDDRDTYQMLLSILDKYPDEQDPFLITTANPVQSSLLDGLLTKLNSKVGKASMTRDVDNLVTALDKNPLYNWTHSRALIIVAYTMASHIDYYGSDVVPMIKQYLGEMSKRPKFEVPNVLFLALARVAPVADVAFRCSCIRLCDTAKLRPLLTDSERQLLSPTTAVAPSVPTNKLPVDEFQSKWDTLKAAPNAIHTSAIDDLMKMIGLRKVKQKVLELYESIWMASRLPAESRVPQAYHFVLTGNPGTGKTTVGKLLCRMLHDLGIRKLSAPIETTGEKLARMGANNADAEIKKAMGGALFIDEAYHLNPKTNADGAAVAMQLLDVAESRQDDITIIIAGCKSDIEDKLFDFNNGFHRRFSYQFHFDDYSDAELGEIFAKLCDKYKWKADAGVVKVAARRVGRGRGRKSFGNAGAVQSLFESAYRRAVQRSTSATPLQTLMIEDILGPRPSRDQIPELNLALEELENTIGLQSVKDKICTMVDLANINYEREIRGEDPIDVPLNKVFFGNPGTGKTTVAKLYGRILRAIGLLSDGLSELKQPSDFLGSAVGETQKKTSGLIERCKGKVLIIDEAYGLQGSSYGAEAIDTLVGLVHNAPGEDIAVIMIGYEKQMRKMFREMNPGLTRRFSLDNPFVFEDYTDTELERIAIKCLRDNGLTASKDVRREFVKAVSVQRFAPNFGNAGTVITMVSNAKARLAARDPSAKELTLEDFGIVQYPRDPVLALEGMFKTEHIVKELKSLQAVIKQCELDGRDATNCVKNYVFVGNAGTGKTTVARSMAGILHNLGLLGRNNIVIRSGLDLQGSYVGQTKDKVNEAMAEAQGGVLFIDEAYTLGGGQGYHSVFAQEAVDQLVALMTEPEHLHRTVVILAGYPDAMQRMLSSSNEGLISRCTGRLDFPDWDAADCMEYIQLQLGKSNMVMEDRATRALHDGLQDFFRRPGWANARDCITILDLLYEARAIRGDSRNLYTFEDVNSVLDSMRKRRPTHQQIPKEYSFKEAHAMFAYLDAPLPPPPPPMKECQVTNEMMVEEIDERMDVEVLGSTDVDPEDPVYAALLLACREVGYDSSHEKRQQLIVILESVQRGGPFTEDIINNVMRKTNLTSARATKVLRPQVHNLLDGMRNAVAAEEERRAELARLADAERKAKEQEREILQQRLAMCGLCPAGFSWHRCGSGWRCAGGSHYVTDLQLLS